MRSRIRTRLTAAAITLTCAGAMTAPALAGGGIEPIRSERVAQGLQFPIFATHAPGDYTRLYIILKRGQIRVLNIKSGAIQGSIDSFLSIDPLVGGGGSQNNEQGLLGLAFHPDFQKNRYYYINYTNNSGNTVVARYTAPTGDTTDTGSATTIITFNQPFSNHNGGWIGFGPNDGYLYISTGDGGAANDPGGRAQDITNQRMGKMLRIDVDGGSPYAIPPSNPFVGVTGDDEIWAYGLRNPWRCSFDRDTGDLYIGDVGQNAVEEIDFQPASSAGGENYGWRCMEGNSCTGLSGCVCNAPTLTDPIHAYNQSGNGFSITGGYVYRGCAIPSLRGTYFFGDYVLDKLWSMPAGGGPVTNRIPELRNAINGGSIFNIATFGEDYRGEIYITDQAGGSTAGEVFKIIPATPTISMADFDCDGVVGFSACDGCFFDLDGDHGVGFNDLVLLLAEWG